MKKKIIVLAASLALLLQAVPALAQNDTASIPSEDLNTSGDEELVKTEQWLTFDPDTGTVTKCDSSVSGELIIPDEINGVPVTSIGERAFYACRDLAGVMIQDGVKSIG